MRDAVAECGPIAEGDWIASDPRRRHRRRDRDRRPTRSARCSACSSTTTARSSPCSSARRARGRDAAHPRAHRVAVPARSRSSSTTAASRCTRTSSASSRRRESRTVPTWRARPLTLARSPRDRGRHGSRASAPRSRRGSRDRWASNVLDLLQHYPRRWVDRTKRADIAELAVGEEATVFAEVQTFTAAARARAARSSRSWSTTARRYSTSRSSTRRGARSSSRPAPKRRSSESSTCTAGKRQMTNPVVDVLGRPGAVDEKTGVIVPVYPQSGKAEVFTWQLRTLVADALARSAGRGLRRSARRRRPRPSTTSSTATSRCGRSTGPSRCAELRSGQAAPHVRRVPAHAGRARRAQARARRGAERDPARVDGPICVPAFHRAACRSRSPGTSSARSTRSPRDIGGPAPMHRLLQGDVGSGKTVVALAALLVGVQGGYQGAFMAPTEVLAEQHYLASTALLDGLDVPAEAHCSATGRCASSCSRTARPPPSAAASRPRLQNGEVDILVGTHALLYGDAEFTRPRGRGDRRAAPLRRRAARAARGARADEPDVLVMTATPIPRTAAMLVYGDLDKSELREMPPGRTPITTEGRRPEPARPGRGVEAPPRPRSRPAARRTSCARSSRTRAKLEAQGRDRGVRAAAGTRSSRACGSGCCTASCPSKREGSGDGRVPAPASSTCSSRRP